MIKLLTDDNKEKILKLQQDTEVLSTRLTYLVDIVSTRREIIRINCCKRRE